MLDLKTMQDGNFDTAEAIRYLAARVQALELAIATFTARAGQEKTAKVAPRRPSTSNLQPSTPKER